MNDDLNLATPVSAAGMDGEVSKRRERNEAIEKFVRTYAACDDQDLLEQMMVTICRLAADRTDRGDLKILNTALRELRYAFKVFAPYDHVPKVTIFGSARTPADHPQYRQALKFAELIQQKGWMVITGAGGGIMHAGHHGASRERSFGVAISLPFEQATNEIIADDSKLINFKYFFTRKLLFIKEAEAIALFPGGFGTQDECFESLTLVQTLKSSPVPIIMCDEPGGTYWQNWLGYVERSLLAHGMVDREDMSLFKVTDSAEAAVEEIARFYRRYHSSRYVGDELVFRLQRPLDEASVREINREFADIVEEGEFRQQTKPLAEENGEHAQHGRLIFRYSRRNAGRLRMLIDYINDAPG